MVRSNKFVFQKYAPVGQTTLVGEAPTSSLSRFLGAFIFDLAFDVILGFLGLLGCPRSHAVHFKHQSASYLHDNSTVCNPWEKCVVVRSVHLTSSCAFLLFTLGMLHYWFSSFSLCITVRIALPQATSMKVGASHVFF